MEDSESAMPKDRGPDYVPLAEAYEQYGRRPVDRLRHDGVLTEATWEDDGHQAVYLLRAELAQHFDKPRLQRGGQEVDAS